MRNRISKWVFMLGVAALLVAAGVMIGAGVEWLMWAVWLLMWPALIVICSALAVERKGRAKNLTGHPPTSTVKPRFGAMREDEE